MKYEEIYTDSQEKVDMAAERIITLEGFLIHTFSGYTDLSKSTIVKDISCNSEA